MLELKRQNYVDWEVRPVFKLLDRNNYAYRVVLKFQDGTQQCFYLSYNMNGISSTVFVQFLNISPVQLGQLFSS